jgi:agmatine deiminase
MIEHHGQRLPATYMNFYIANGLVIVPTFGRPSDGKALEIHRKEMPDHKVVGLDSLALIWGLGSFHCLSQQEPA